MPPAAVTRALPESSSGRRRELVPGRAALAAVLVAVGLVGAACSSPGSTTAAPPTSTTVGTAATPAQVSALVAKLRAGSAASYRATYTASGNGTNGVGSFTIASIPPDAKIEFTTAGKAAAIVTRDDKEYLCAASAGAWGCLSGLSGNAGAAESSSFAWAKGPAWLPVLAAARAGGGATSYSTRTVAGVPLECLTVTEDDAGGEGTFCLTSAGVLGDVQATERHRTYSFRLTSYETSPPASAVALPAAPSSVPAVP